MTNGKMLVNRIGEREATPTQALKFETVLYHPRRRAVTAPLS